MIKKTYPEYGPQPREPRGRSKVDALGDGEAGADAARVGIGERHDELARLLLHARQRHVVLAQHFRRDHRNIRRSKFSAPAMYKIKPCGCGFYFVHSRGREFQRLS